MSIVAMRRSQIGVETVVGTAVPPTRQLAGTLSLENQPDRQQREERRASMGGSLAYDDMSYRSRGTYSGRAYNDELVYFASAAIGYVAPVAGVWTFDQPMDATELAARPLRSLTGYAGIPLPNPTTPPIGTGVYRAAGMVVERLVIAGADRGPWTVNHAVMGRELVSAATAGEAAADTYKFNEALDTPLMSALKTLMSKISFGAPAASPAPTDWVNTAFSFTWTFNTGIVLEYTMDQQLDYREVQRDIPTATLEIVAKLNKTAAIEYASFHDRTTRFIRITHGTSNSTLIEGVYVQTGFVPLDSERDGTQLCRLTFTAIEDTTWGGKVKLIVPSAVATFPLLVDAPGEGA